MIIRLLVILLFPACLFAQIDFGITDLDRAEFRNHRESYLERTGGQISVIFGAYHRLDDMRWRQDNRFYYLTGVEEPNAVLVLNGKSGEIVLFLEEIADGNWGRHRIGPGSKAVALYGIADVRVTNELEGYLKSAVSAGDTLLFNVSPEETATSPTDVVFSSWWQNNQQPWARDESFDNRLLPKSFNILNWIRAEFPETDIQNAATIIDDLRRVKSAWEIERIRQSCSITVEAFKAAMKKTKPGVGQHILIAEAQYQFVSHGAFYNTFFYYLAEGNEIPKYFYPPATGVLGRKNLVMMDLGADFRYYTSDLTRTWPVSGKFSAKYRKQYESLLRIRSELIEFLKPGITLQDIQAKYDELLVEEGYGPDNGVPVCHYVGMNGHDRGDRYKPLERNVVIALEPGLYFRNYGMRIEDVFLITKNGSQLLSEGLPTEIEEIESLINN